MRIRGFIACSILAAVAGAACEQPPGERVLAVEATAIVLGLVYLDANGNGALDASDPPQPSVNVRLVERGTQDTVARARSGANGAYAMLRVPVGTYTVAVDTASFADTIRVVSLDHTELPLHANDSVVVTVGVGFPVVSIPGVRVLPPGRRVFLDAVAANSPGLFGDTTVHLIGPAAAIRATRARSLNGAFGAGDSVRVTGRTSIRNGQPVLDDASIFPIAPVLAPVPLVLTTAQAASAVNGTADARLVRVVGIVTDTATVRGDYHLTITDGSGPVVIVLDGDARLAPGNLPPGTSLRIVGLLVPVVEGGFRLKPRFNDDLIIL